MAGIQISEIRNADDVVVGVTYAAPLEPSWPDYFKQLGPSLHSIFHLSDITFIDSGRTYALLPELLHRYIYSMTSLGASLLIAFFLSLILALVVMMLPGKVRSGVKAIFQAIQSIPDIFYLIFFVLATIVLYEKTHLLLFEITEFDKQIYGLPIVLLTFFPTLQITQYLIINMEDEWAEPYAEFAGAKGLCKGRVVAIHVLRNALITFFPT
ncbi:ABC transporter permease subunit [Camelliibacillus cellulosilyticus]|uniref:ABC transporter permease subunit n=1 Tax=Camelliibacillus cellulosilyticus TaxID=2174486 RepID=A0ABV9GSJ0_9BACL